MGLVDLVGEQLRTFPAALAERVVIGSATAQEIAAEVEGWCAEHLGAPVADAWLWRVSVGCVAGLSLGDGRRVVVKAYAPDRSPERVAAVLDAQRHARSNGLPAAEPIVGPQPLGRGHATAETVLDAGRNPVLHAEPDRSTVAHAWGMVTKAFRGAEHLVSLAPPTTLGRALYPTPHSPVFDFESAAAGAEWIDALAAQARTVTDAFDAPATVVHTDWRGDNIRVTDDGTSMAAVYDWESLRLDREVIALGHIAAHHSIDWSGPAEPYFATAEECSAFARAVERSRSQPFTTVEWRALRAAIVSGWCYTARCEHALAAAGADDRRFRMRERLRTDAGLLLD